MSTPELQAKISPQEKASLDEMIADMLPISRHSAGLANDAAIADEAIAAPYPLERITAPTLLVHARDDPAAMPAGAEDTARRIPGAALKWLESGGHVLLGHHAEVRAQVHDFLVQHTAGR